MKRNEIPNEQVGAFEDKQDKSDKSEKQERS